ncbi:MAG: sialate O-acetylesterase [Phycisphaerae bacterium]|nr:sialate O-acetylesterase [Phycisphaerae bacterium]
MARRHNILVLFLVFSATVVAIPSRALHAAKGTVKVFILDGQSNAGGTVGRFLLDHQAKDPKTKNLFKHLRKDGKWIVRDDVFIKFLKRKGPLTIGYGWGDRTGVEFEFGNVMGNNLDDPVLLIKAGCCCNLYQSSRPPSAGLPSDKKLQKDLDQARARVKQNNKKHKRNDPLPTMDDIKKPYGSAYRVMLSEVKNVLDNYETLFPALKGKKLELAGFLWFQGFSDQSPERSAEYESNMKHYIKDVRRDLKAPKLPFVIAALGMNGSKPAKGGMLTVRNAQLAMNDVPEFKGNVKAFRTDLLADKEAERLFPNWPKHHKEWVRVGSDIPCHYLGSAIWHNRIGRSMANAMLKMLGKGK